MIRDLLFDDSPPFVIDQVRWLSHPNRESVLGKADVGFREWRWRRPVPAIACGELSFQKTDKKQLMSPPKQIDHWSAEPNYPALKRAYELYERCERFEHIKRRARAIAHRTYDMSL